MQVFVLVINRRVLLGGGLFNSQRADHSGCGQSLKKDSAVVAGRVLIIVLLIVHDDSPILSLGMSFVSVYLARCSMKLKSASGLLPLNGPVEYSKFKVAPEWQFIQLPLICM